MEYKKMPSLCFTEEGSGLQQEEAPAVAQMFTSNKRQQQHLEGDKGRKREHSWKKEHQLAKTFMRCVKAAAPPRVRRQSRDNVLAIWC